MLNIFTTIPLKILASFFASFIITLLAIPSIVNVARVKNLVAIPNGRTVHNSNVPNLGGIAIFAGLLISKMIFVDFRIVPELQYATAGTIIIFFLGLKDDIISISPWKKLWGEIMAAFLVVVFADIRFTSLHGFLGIQVMPYFFSLVLSIFVIIVIINCFNLIDGIDGLASGLAIVSAATFGVWFYLRGEYQYTILSAGLIGSLFSFFNYNVFGHKNKIFMGDTGSLILGFFMAVMVIKFNECNLVTNLPYTIHSAPVVSFGILFLPLFDTIRVFMLRIFNNCSPFKADRNHIHHSLLALNLSHLKATIILICFNAFFILLVFMLQDLGMIQLGTIIFSLGILLSFIPISILKSKNRIQKEFEKKKAA